LTQFVDEVRLLVQSGKGGPGCVSFRREKFIPRGGPDGGDGGRGGDVILVADGQMSTLLDYRFQPRHLAQNGRPGAGANKSGADGHSVRLPMPVGTCVFDHASGELLVDMHEDGGEHVLLQGGRGGKGNFHFRSSVQQAPRFAQPGEEGHARELRLELKLLADVGLIGFPNVGKSSLIRRISAARPKVADYPFTTLVPSLGVVQTDGRHFVVADVPGLIVGAHRGAGLGTRFLRHVERVRIIAHLVTVTEDEARDPIGDYRAIESELCLHNPKLMDVRHVLVLNRMDLPWVAARRDEVAAFAAAAALPFYPLSAATGVGVGELVQGLQGLLASSLP
jgi:GTP-binding protein